MPNTHALSRGRPRQLATPNPPEKAVQLPQSGLTSIDALITEMVEADLRQAAGQSNRGGA